MTILVIDHLDNSLKSAGQVEEALDIPVLGHIIENKRSGIGLVTLHDPFSAEAEVFRTLGASLEIIGTGKRLRTVMVMNAEPTETKTVIAANLAVINAQQGKHVILLDGDLRHPHLHSFFGVENEIGFAELLNESADIKSACHTLNDLQGLIFIPGGVAEKELTSWLDVKKWEQLLLKLHKLADLVIVDSPPADMADAQILASKMDAILLSIMVGHTRIDTAQGTLKRLQLIDAKVAGAVLNRITRSWKINKPPLTWFKIRIPKKEKFNKVDGEIDKQAISLS